MIEVKNLNKFYGPKQALQGLSFEVRSGEIIGLVGKNGAGKSTVLKILSAQMLPSGGEVVIDGIQVAEEPERIRAQIGYLPEVAPLYREMTVRAYLDFAGRLRQIPESEIESRIDQVLSDTGLTHMAGERLGGLSRGYQQRVGIAQAVIHRPPVILLDEPMSGLDPLQIVHIRDLILSLRKKHTVLFSSHILSEITNVCDRVILIDEGKVKAVGAESELRGALSSWSKLTLKIRGEKKKLTETIAKIKGVTLENAASEGGKDLAVALTCQSDLREDISKALVKAGLGLLEMKGGQEGLEDLFLAVLGEEE